MIIYIDSNFKCYTQMAEGLRDFDISFFDNKCSTFIEGYRYVPTKEIWVREDGVEFKGEMITPWKDYELLEIAQAQYEKDLVKQEELQTVLNILIGE